MMGSDNIELAKKYQRLKKREKASYFFEEHFKDNDSCTEEDYITYSKYLMETANTQHAEKVLLDGQKKHPKSEGILLVTYQLYYQQRNWSKAEKVVSNLINLNKNEAEYYFMMGGIYAWLRNKQESESYFKQGFVHKHSMSFETLIETIQQKFVESPNEKKTIYMLSSEGRNNFGMMIHNIGQKKYITKISKKNISAINEKNFYENVVKKFSVLQGIVPAYVDSLELNNIQYLTMEMIEDPNDEKPDLSNVIKKSQEISTVKYNDMVTNFPNRKYSYIVRSGPNSISSFFTQIHKEEYNQMLFTSLRNLFSQKKQISDMIEMLDHIERLFLENKFYQFINPEEHYSLMHGDFRPSNMKARYEDNELLIFDWSTFRIGPHFMDLARYFQAGLTSYTVIRESYLFNENNIRKLSEIEQLYFLLAYILFHSLTITKRNKEIKLSKFIYPALIDMEIISAKITKTEVNLSNYVLQLIISQYIDLNKVNRSHKKKIVKLRQEQEELENEVLKVKRNLKRTKKHLKSIKESKSWKITAPLRSLTNRFKK